MELKQNLSLLVKIQLVASTLLIIILLIGFLYLKKELDVSKREINGYRKFFTNYTRERTAQDPSNSTP